MRVELLVKQRSNNQFVNRTSHLMYTSGFEWSVEQNAFGNIDNFSFVLDDPNRILPRLANEEVILRNSDNISDVLFAGSITEVSEATIGIGIRYNVTALGWGLKLDRTLVTQTYYGRSDQFIITNDVAVPTGTPLGIFGSSDDAEYFNDWTINTTNVEVGIANTQFHSFQDQTIRNILDTLSSASGYVWRIDADKTFYYHAQDGVANPFNLSDNPTSSLRGYRAFRRHIDVSKLINVIKVVGGFRELFTQARTYGNSAGVSRISNHDRFHAAEGEKRVSVDVNRGTENSPIWSPLVVGLDGFDELGEMNTDGEVVTVIWSPSLFTLTFQTPPPSFQRNSYRISGDVLQPIIDSAQDNDSVAEYGQYSIIIRDSSLVTEEEVLERARGELRKRIAQVEKVTCTIRDDGVKVAQTIQITNEVHGLSARRYFIDKVKVRPLSTTLTEYELTLRSIVSSV